MMRPGTTLWFFRHELRLAWRDWIWLLSGGRRRRLYAVALGTAAFVGFLHLLAYATLPHAVNLTGAPDGRTLAAVGGALLLYGSLMLSQALEAVTRAFYARGDLDLLLSSPAVSERLFGVRIATLTAGTAAMALMLAGPAIDVLAWLGGWHWLAGYGVMLALAMAAVGLSTLLTMALFAAIGPKRTRLVAQIIAAIVGAGFVIGIQFVAIMSAGTMSRIDFLRSQTVVDRMPASGSLYWVPARAVAGNWLDLAVVVGIGAAILAVAVRLGAPRFAGLALSTAAIAAGPRRARRRRSAFHATSPAQALRRKEWALLRRDPWLMSQTLMQLLYLLPAFFLLTRSFYGYTHGATVLVPVLIMAAGQLAGGLTWLAVSGEDAPDLIGSAPVSNALIWRAKAEAVFGVIALFFGPAVALLAILAPAQGAAALFGIAASAASASLIQFWFRAQAKRTLFRRRHVSSRIATFAEAFSSITWSSAGAVALVSPWMTLLPGSAALVVLAGAWSISPRRG
jgi:ABC-2 type transport system permease protein